MHRRKRTNWRWMAPILIAAMLAATQTTSGAVGGSTRPATIDQRPGAYPVVDTGQTRCYDAHREIACPTDGEAFRGQDAQHVGNPPRYADNGDGTITDLNTGLVWQQTPGEKVTYAQAGAGAAALDLAGHHDWRLPTIKELYSLIDFGGVDPSGSSGTDTSSLVAFIDTSLFDFEYGAVSAGERIIDAQYWSGTEYVGTTMDGSATVFGVNFADGRIKGYPRDRGPRGSDMTQFVRAVRDAEDVKPTDTPTVAPEAPP